MEYYTRISKKTPKTKRPEEKYEYSLISTIRKTPFLLDKTKKFTIGRKSKNSLTLLQHTTSDLHASIKWEKSGFKLKDEKSTNGTFLNGKRIDQTTLLKNGDKIKVGKFVIKFKAKKIRIKKK